MKYYFLKPGDTLSTTASLYDTTVEEILKINDIENPDLIYPNYAVLIPKSARLCPFPQREVVIRREEATQVRLVPEPTLKPAPTSTPASVPTKKYEVQAGDNLFKIAQKFNTVVGTLVSLNNITDPNLIYQGKEIWVPDITT